MKKLYIILSALTLIFSILFYHQDFGINLLLFNLLLIGCLFFLNPFIYKNRSILLIVIACLLSSASATILNSAMAITLNIISLIVLAGFFYKPGSSFIIALSNSVYSFLVALIIKVFENFNNETGARTDPHKSRKKRLTFRKVTLILIPIVITSLFFGLYFSANPAFEQLISGIEIDFISWEWIKFTSLAFILVFSFFNQTDMEFLSTADQNASNVLTRIRLQRPFRNFIGLKYEYKSGLIMFVLLNSLLLLFNGTDIYYLHLNKLKDNLTYAAYLHQGIYSLIFSITLAILIILYYFRGNINFLTKNNGLRNLVYLWIIQNGILVYTSLIKNWNYISEYGLTYKRIGVYCYLLLTLIGLFTTFIKIRKVKSNWYLLRINTWLFYWVLVLGALFNWDNIITNYNLDKNEKPDLLYLINLSDTNLPQLITFRSEHPHLLSANEKIMLKEKEELFIQKMEERDWPSWNYNDIKVYKKLDL